MVACEFLAGHKVLKVLVVRNDLNRMVGFFELWAPFFKALDNGQMYIVLNVVLTFGC